MPDIGLTCIYYAIVQQLYIYVQHIKQYKGRLFWHPCVCGGSGMRGAIN